MCNALLVILFSVKPAVRKEIFSSATMLEAPPGSREDLVEAARTPCTPTGR